MNMLRHGTMPSMSLEEMPGTTFKVARYNFYAMHGQPFKDTLSSESIGGNAGAVTIDDRRFSCAAVNGYAKKTSGRFITFGNFQNLDPAIVQNPDYEEVSVISGFRFDSSLPNGHESRLVEFYTRENHDFTPEALDAMLGAIALYNEVHSDL